MPLEAITVIDLDTSRPNESVVHAKQYDTARVVEAHLSFDGAKWQVPQNNIYAMVSFNMMSQNNGRSHSGGFYDLTERGEQAVVIGKTVDSAVDRSIIFIAIDRQVVTTAGDVQVEVIFYDTTNNSRFGSFYFIVQVESAAVRELNVADNPNFEVLAEQMGDILNLSNSLVGMRATATKLAAGANPTVSVSGGKVGNVYTPYQFAFGIPKGDTGTAASVTSWSVQYATSTSGSVVPSSGWTNTPNPEELHYVWTRVTIAWNNNTVNTMYSVAYTPAGAAAPVLYVEQTLTTAQKKQARTNIAAAQSAEIKANFEITTIAQLLSLLNNSLSSIPLGPSIIQIKDTATDNRAIVICQRLNSSTTSGGKAFVIASLAALHGYTLTMASGVWSASSTMITSGNFADTFRSNFPITFFTLTATSEVTTVTTMATLLNSKLSSIPNGLSIIKIADSSVSQRAMILCMRKSATVASAYVISDTDALEGITMTMANGAWSSAQKPLPLSSGGTGATTAQQARTNLGVSIYDVVEKRSGNISIAATSGANGSFSAALSDTSWTPIGILGYSIIDSTTTPSSPSFVMFSRCILDGTSVKYWMRNTSSSANNVIMVVKVLYKHA